MLHEKPVVAVPLYAIRHAQIGGTEFAIYNLIRGLAQHAQIEISYAQSSFLSEGFNRFVSTSPNVTAYDNFGIPGPKNVRFLEEAMFELVRKDHEYTVYPNYFIPPKRPLSRTTSAVILHDIQYKALPQYHSPRRRAWLDFYLPRAFNNADRVILISESERLLVDQHFGSHAARKCDVVWNAIDWTRFLDGSLSDRVKEMVKTPYVLSVFHHFPHKNVTTLLRAFTLLAKRIPEIRLYLVGKASQTTRETIASNVPAEVASRIDVLGFVSDRELGLFYSHASLFALPSLYEGFGMPAVEALGHGVPTLVSGTTALPEVTLGQARYVEDPLSVEQWASEMYEILRSGARPNEAVTRMVRETFQPDVIAKTFLASLKSAQWP